MPTKEALAYLTSVAQADLAAAFPFLPAFAEFAAQSAPDQARPGLPPVAAPTQEPLTLLASEDWRLRASALLQIPPRWPLEPRLVTTVFQSAFQDTDARVRGTALAVIADAARAENAEALFRNALGAIRNRFAAPAEWPEAISVSSVGEWLQMLSIAFNNLRGWSGIRRGYEELAAREAAELASLGEDDLELFAGEPSRGVELLDDPMPSRRRAGLVLVSWIKSPSSDAVGKVLSIASSDPDEAVRLRAVQTAVRLCRDTNDPDAKRTLAEIVKHDLCHQRLWSAAYSGLFDIQGRPYSEWPGIRAAQSGRDPYLLREEDIDWEYIAACLEAT